MLDRSKCKAYFTARATKLRGYDMYNNIIFNPAHAIAVNPEYFKQFKPRQAGDNRRIMGKIHPNMIEKASYYVVRVNHRHKRHYRKEYTCVRATDRRAYRSAGQLTQRCYYTVSATSYLVVKQAWNGDITEISVHPTRQAGAAALQQFVKTPSI